MNGEKLSALLDGELDEEETQRVIAQVSADAQLARTWQRYHLIRAGIRREPAEPNEALCARIAASLEREPVVLASGNAPARRPAASGATRRWYALAAGLAMIAATGWWLAERQGVSPLSPPVSDPGSGQIAARTPAREAVNWQERPEMAERLNALLLRHGEFTPAPGMNGLAAYAKFMSYDAR